MSGQDWPVGMVAMVTALNRREPYRAFFDGHTWRELAEHAFCVDSPTDVRPLVVLDIPNLGHAVEILREYAEGHGWSVLDNIANEIEAQTKPPRIPEPGWGAIVEAGRTQHDVRRLRWMAVNSGHWQCQNADEYPRLWSDLIDPVLVRPGIEEDQ